MESDCGGLRWGELFSRWCVEECVKPVKSVSLVLDVTRSGSFLECEKSGRCLVCVCDIMERTIN